MRGEVRKRSRTCCNLDTALVTAPTGGDFAAIFGAEFATVLSGKLRVQEVVRSETTHASPSPPYCPARRRAA